MKLEILFDDENKMIHKYLINLINELRFLGNKSEVWIMDFFDDPNNNSKEIDRITTILQCINKLMLRDYIVTRGDAGNLMIKHKFGGITKLMTHEEKH